MMQNMTATFSDFGKSWRAMPWPVRVYLAGYFLLLFFLMFWVPGNDFDTMSSYIARIKLEEFGDLRQTGTLELQYLFPKFFDYMNKPFLEWGWFTTFPAFALFCAAAWFQLKFFGRKERLIWLFFILACPPILVAVTSFKNDLPVACFAVLAWYALFIRRNSSTYLPLGMLALAALAGTKWHGFFVIVPFGIGFLWQLCRTHRPDKTALFLAALAVPLCWIASSGQVYVDNFRQFGTPFPRPAWLTGQTLGWHHLPVNLYKFISSTFIDTFDVPLYLIDKQIGWKIWPNIEALTLHGKVYNYAFLINSEFSAFGLVLLFALGCSAFILFRRKESFAVKMAGAGALAYALLVLCFIDYSSWTNRYFIAAYMLGLIPTVRLLGRMAFSKTIIMLAATYALLLSLQAVLLNQDKLLKGLHWSMPAGQSYNMSPIWRDFFKRDRLYFHVWGGYANIYDELQKDVQVSDSLVFINTAKDGQVPFLYPLIKDRAPANTRIINIRNGGAWDPSLCRDFRFVLIYKGAFGDPNYERIYAYDGENDMSLYRRKTACR